MHVELHPDARAEFRAATLWYDEQRTELAERFVAAVTTVLQRVGTSPESFPVWPGTHRLAGPAIRKALVDDFPYLIAFEQYTRFVLVLAVAHQKRRPLYWIARANSPRS